MFGKKKINSEPTQQQVQFKKEKLSVDALDHFAESYATDQKNPSPVTIPYTMKDGKQIEIDRLKITQISKKHFQYLLGQTLPYHQEAIEYHLKDLMYIINENGKPEPWCRDKKAIVQFTQIADKLGYLIELEELSDDPRNPIYGVIPQIQPVIHIEN